MEVKTYEYQTVIFADMLTDAANPKAVVDHVLDAGGYKIGRAIVRDGSVTVKEVKRFDIEYGMERIAYLFRLHVVREIDEAWKVHALEQFVEFLSTQHGSGPRRLTYEFYPGMVLNPRKHTKEISP